MRTKKVKIEEQEFVIAPLNMEQVEALMDTEAPDAGDVKAWRARGLQTVCNGLNNAKAPGNDDATPERLRSTLDLPTFNALHAAIIEFSGLKAPAVGESKPTSEAAALTSDTSAAA